MHFTCFCALVKNNYKNVFDSDQVILGYSLVFEICALPFQYAKVLIHIYILIGGKKVK